MFNFTIEELRDLGFRVYVRHNRKVVKLPNGAKWEGTPQFRRNGGSTYLEITTPPDSDHPNGVTLSTVAICRNTEQFSRKEGLKTALARIFVRNEEVERRIIQLNDE